MLTPELLASLIGKLEFAKIDGAFDTRIHLSESESLRVSEVSVPRGRLMHMHTHAHMRVHAHGCRASAGARRPTRACHALTAECVRVRRCRTLG